VPDGLFYNDECVKLMSLFDIFKRKRSDTDEGVPASMFDEIDQAHEEELERIGEYLEERLERVKVDARRRKFVLAKGRALGIAELARTIHKEQPDMALDDIEQCVTDWLEQSYWPEGVSEAQMGKLQTRIEDWVEDHQNGAIDEQP